MSDVSFFFFRFSDKHGLQIQFGTSFDHTTVRSIATVGLYALTEGSKNLHIILKSDMQFLLFGPKRCANCTLHTVNSNPVKRTEHDKLLTISPPRFSHEIEETLL